MKPDWETQFAAMRVQFLNRATDRIVKVATAIDDLTANPADKEKLAEVRQHFHWLAGAGGTYQLPNATELGNAGQDICDACLEADRVPAINELQQLKEMIERARSIISTALTSVS